MALNWTDKQNGTDGIMAEDINEVAHAIEDLEDVAHSHNNKAILDAINTAPLADAPTNSNLYGRQNGTWSTITIPESIPTITMADLDELTDVEPYCVPILTRRGIQT